MPNVPSGALTDKTLITWIREDLSDADATNFRWTDPVINREIDRSLDRYSQVAPSINITQIATIPYSRLYAVPNNAWWIERVEYPIGRWPKQWQKWFDRPSPKILDPLYTNPYFLGAPQFAGTPQPGAGVLPAGTYQYAFTWLTPGGYETLPSAPITVILAAPGATQLSNLPQGPYGAVDLNIYRTARNAAQLQLLTNLGSSYKSTSNIGSTANLNVVSYTDQALDATLGANVPTQNTTEGNPMFEVQLDQSRLPIDNSGILEIWVAYKHELDQFGTTVPEKHWDAIALGAEAFLALAYVANVNDNFDYVDGQFRDRVDDTKSAIAWQVYADDLMKKFKERLDGIRNQQTATTPDYPQWGDKPIRWDRI